MSIGESQRQRHGVSKNLVESVGGVILGAALVLLATRLLRSRAARPATVAPDSPDTHAAPPTADAQSRDQNP